MVKKYGPLTFETPVQYLKGIGPGRAIRLERLGIKTVQDLLYFIPRRYIDYSRLVKIKDVKIKEEVTISGKVIAAQVKKTRRGVNVVMIAVNDGTGIITVRWFNRPDLKKKFKINDTVVLSGKVSYYYGKQLVNPNYEILNSDCQDSSLYAGSVIPVYPLTEGLNLWELRRAIKVAYERLADAISDSIPQYLIEKNQLLKLKDALYNLHFPETISIGIEARKRLVYEELFIFELLLALRRREVLTSQRGYIMVDKQNLTQRFLSKLPFELTGSQKRAIEEIKRDMSSPHMMNRLLQGDVGSGKTIVALYAMLIAVENGFQAALMAPTEILAEQHFISYSEKLKEIGVDNELLTGSIKGKRRNEILEGIRSGDIKMVFGTHALIEKDVEFHNLGLAVVDEQHRFGVVQRATLANKGITPDFLVMTATPIPRTLSMTIYGDLDISTLDEKPPGRKPTVTKLIRYQERAEVYQFIRKKINEKFQVFMVYPIIEESEKVDLRSATDAYNEISSIFKEFRIGLIHGRMNNQQQMQVMEDFRSGGIDILVSTTVIEVGVDIPNAVIMVIEHPERFGLAQLHQLRGRVGRGGEESFCFLLLDRWVPAETYERLHYFEKNDNGFHLAEKDLEIRGPGEILGERQHGLSDLHFADLINDIDLLKKARDDAFELVKTDSGLERFEHRSLKNLIVRKYWDRLNLSRIG